jgi:hypothetical protein
MSERRRPVRPGYKRLTIQLPEELLSELYAVAGRSVSGWIEKVVVEKLEAERRRRLLRELPTPLREKLVKAAGSEEDATRLLIKVIEKGLAEIEEDEVEEAAQVAIGFAHRQERLAEARRG